MRKTKALHHVGDVLTIATDGPSPGLSYLGGLAVQITELYWEETAWGYAVALMPDQDVRRGQERLLGIITLHDPDFVT